MYLFKRNQLAISIGLVLGFPHTLFAAAPSSANNSIETVIVRGVQNKPDLEKEQSLTPGGVTVLDSAELNERNVSNLSDMLRYVPGIWTASGSTGDSSFFSSRGSNLDATNYDGNGIKLLQDGLPVTAADGNNHNRLIDPLSARFATVALGANALTYGASTLGGAIDFITPTARDTDSEIVLNGGSHGQVQGRITTGAAAGDVDGLLTLESRQWDGFREHHEQERKGIYANAGWRLSDAVNTRFYLTYIDNNQKLPGALTAAEFEEDPYQAQASAREENGHYQYNVETWRVANKTVWDINANSSLSVGFSLEDQQLYHPIVYNPFFSLLIDTEQRNAGTAVRYNLRSDDHDLLAGLNYGETTVEGGDYFHSQGRRGNRMAVVDNNADSLEIFLVDRWQVADQWKLIYGVQAVTANREVTSTGIDADFDSVNPRVGVIYQLNANTEIFSNLSRLYEAPTTYELEDDINPDAKAFDAMHGEVFEVGTRGSSTTDIAEWNWALSVYYAKLQDEILSVDDPNAPGTSLSANVDDTIHAGVEAVVSASFSLGEKDIHRLEPRVSVTINEFSFDGDVTYDNNQLPAAPGYAIKGEILYRNSNGFFAGPTFDVIDERYADFSNTYTIDSYTLLGFRAGVNHSDWEIYADLRNLTDKKYVGVHSVVNKAAPNAAILQAGEPRSVYVGARIKF